MVRYLTGLPAPGSRILRGKLLLLGRNAKGFRNLDARLSLISRGSVLPRFLYRSWRSSMVRLNCIVYRDRARRIALRSCASRSLCGWPCAPSHVLSLNPIGLDNERVAFPFADRVSIPSSDRDQSGSLRPSIQISTNSNAGPRTYIRMRHPGNWDGDLGHGQRILKAKAHGNLPRGARREVPISGQLPAPRCIGTIAWLVRMRVVTACAATPSAAGSMSARPLVRHRTWRHTEANTPDRSCGGAKGRVEEH
jgi:hypothetical protein